MAFAWKGSGKKQNNEKGERIIPEIFEPDPFRVNVYTVPYYYYYYYW
jgi:hypothetical protein